MRRISTAAWPGPGWRRPARRRCGRSALPSSLTRLVLWASDWTACACSPLARSMSATPPLTTSMPCRICPSAFSASPASRLPSSATFRPSVEAVTASRAVPCRPRTILAMSALAAAARSDSARISSATTANPRPCSPARAASMLAFSDSRLVRSAIRLMVWTMSPISSDLLPISRMTADESCIAWRIAVMPAIERPTTVPPSRAVALTCSVVRRVFDDQLDDARGLPARPGSRRRRCWPPAC